ncbi:MULTISPECIES: porin [unclassified Mesorhizobium]|uniref:porin n=1 Tax=unclassified Mesorhizobium TaxID=325217 RepID=UPI00112A0954|nr:MULTISPECIES: porin [unclassified Mesorhizobium]TPN01571.1 porin [Mesorhizobium sp. B2-1-3A]BCG89352.1 porin [Mesorhizobium sp. 113-3-9]
MNIKSLLLGSAAALIAVSGARAADAVVVAEPEPAEYVKICDVYGAGYFYIPGTETCLRIGGYVRYDAGFGDVGTFTGARADDVVTGKNQGTWYKDARFTLKTWTGQETELGTLKTYTETRMNFQNHPLDNGDANDASNSFDQHFAWIQLGGLRVGLDESAFDTFVGYAGNVINDTIVPYGGFKTGVVQYYFDAGNGFSAMASLEEGSGGASQEPGVSYGYGRSTIDSYVPHVVGGLKYTQGWGDIVGVVAYDSNYEYVSGKVRVDVNISSALSLFGMFGYASEGKLNDNNPNNLPVPPLGSSFANGRGFYKPWGGNWGFWAGGTYKFNEKTSFNLQVSGDQWKDYGVAANIAYTVVPGFTVTPEVDYQHVGSGAINAGNVWAGAEKKNAVGAIIRFQRDF